jgi:hypothetical protein
MYGSLVVGFGIGCTTSGSYHGGISMRRLGAGYFKDPIGGLKGGLLGGSPSNEPPPCEFLVLHPMVGE